MTITAEMNRSIEKEKGEEEKEVRPYPEAKEWYVYYNVDPQDPDLCQPHHDQLYSLYKHYNTVYGLTGPPYAVHLTYGFLVTKEKYMNLPLTEVVNWKVLPHVHDTRNQLSWLQ